MALQKTDRPIEEQSCSRQATKTAREEGARLLTFAGAAATGYLSVEGALLFMPCLAAE